MNKIALNIWVVCFSCCMLWSPSSVFAQAKNAPVKQSSAKKVVKDEVFSIVTLYDEIRVKLSALKDDPFDSRKKANDEKAIYAEYVGREFLIPSPAPGSKIAEVQVGGRQNIWPLEYGNGNISLYFHDSSAADNNLRDSPFVYWTYYKYDSNGGGRQVRDGRYCQWYRSIDGYGVSSRTPNRAMLGLPAATNFQKKWDDDWIKLTGSMDIDSARKLSGNVLTYVSMKSIDYISSYSIADGGYIMPNDSSGCYAGHHRTITGEIGKIRIVDKTNNSLIAVVEFAEYR